MAIRSRTTRAFVTLITIGSLVLSNAATLVIAAPPVAAKTAPPVDGGWPKSFVTPTGAKVVLYQPQVASWTDQKMLSVYSAVSYTPAGATAPVLGTLKAQADTKVSVTERLVDFSVFHVTDSNFPTLDKAQVQEIVAEVVKSIPQVERVIALDRVLAGIDKSQIIPKNTGDLRADPPPIFFSSRPAVMLNIDGAPVWNPAAPTSLEYAVNTNWDLFKQSTTGTLYLRNGKSWLKAPALNGPWTAAGVLPAGFTELPASENWQGVKTNLPGVPFVEGKLPTVFVSQRPAELILLRGVPTYQPVTGTVLNWVSNTDSDVFRVGTSGAVYYLVAGRWFSAPDFNGPWTFATPTLPADFKKIPIDHPRSRVLASVPGTPEASEAVLIASIPQTARVSKTLAAPMVAYQGIPDFQKIESTTVARALNTDKDVFLAGTLYYLCYDGVWFVGNTPTGPWSVTSTIPAAIYEIPPSSPAYNVTFVTAKNDDDDEWVDFTAAAAYTGLMIGWGCAVWGSGYYYPPYFGYGGAYFPYYPTYGYSAWYNPWTSSYGRAGGIYGPYGGAGVGARYNPATGTFSRGAAAWGPYGGAAAGRAYNPGTGTLARGGVVSGPYGARGAASAFNPRTGAFGATRQGSGVYGSWGSTSVQRGDQWANTSRVTSNRTGATTRATEGSAGGAALTRNGAINNSGVIRTPNGDIYAGRDGNVYRNQGGSWQKYDGGGWDNSQRPTPLTDRPNSSRDYSVSDQLNRDSLARSNGAQRANDWSNVRSRGGYGGDSFRPRGGGGFSGGGFGGGGFRGGGGGFRGGGGRR